MQGGHHAQTATFYPATLHASNSYHALNRVIPASFPTRHAHLGFLPRPVG